MLGAGSKPCLHCASPEPRGVWRHPVAMELGTWSSLALSQTLSGAEFVSER